MVNTKWKQRQTHESGSVLEWQTLNHQNPGSNPGLSCQTTHLVAPVHSDINEHLAIYTNGLCILIAARLNAFQRYTDGIQLNKLVRQ